MLSSVLSRACLAWAIRYSLMTLGMLCWRTRLTALEICLAGMPSLRERRARVMPNVEHLPLDHMIKAAGSLNPLIWAAAEITRATSWSPLCDGVEARGTACGYDSYCKSVLRLGAPKFTKVAWECSKYCDQKSPSASMVLPER